MKNTSSSLSSHLIKIGDNWTPFSPADLTCIEKWKWQLLLEVWFGTESDMSCLLVDCDACYMCTNNYKFIAAGGVPHIWW